MVALKKSLLRPTTLRDVEKEIYKVSVIEDFDNEQVSAVAMCPATSLQSSSKNCILVAIKSEIYVFNFFPHKPEDTPNVLKLNKKYSVDSSVENLAMSPASDSKLHPFPFYMAFSSDTGDIFSLSDLIPLSFNKGESSELEPDLELKKLPMGHKSFINGLSFDSTGTFLASVSDDKSCLIWNVTTDTEQVVLNFESRPVSFKWHHTDPRKFFVFLSAGLIVLYNLEEQVPIMSLNSLKSNLLHGDWSVLDDSLVVATVMKDCLLWRVTESAVPCDPVVAVPEGKVDLVSCSKTDKDIFAISTVNDNALCVFNCADLTGLVKFLIKFEEPLDWIEWLPERNVCAVLSGCKLSFVDFN